MAKNNPDIEIDMKYRALKEELFDKYEEFYEVYKSLQDIEAEIEEIKNELSR